MQINNKITTLLSGTYTYFGLIFVPICILSSVNQQWIMAGVTFIIIAYLFGTSSGVDIDTEHKTFRTYNKHFGIFKTGKWKPINTYIGLTLIPIRKYSRMYSRSNRINSSVKKEYRIYFVNKIRKPAIPIKVCKTNEEALNKLDELAIWLHLPVFSPKGH